MWTLPRGVEDIKRNRRRRWHLRNAPRGQAPVKDGHLYCSPVPSGFRASYGFPAGVVAADPPRRQSSKRQPAPHPPIAPSGKLHRVLIELSQTAPLRTPRRFASILLTGSLIL